MRTLELQNGYRIHQILKERSNAFVIETKEELLLVDTGRQNDFELIFQVITDLVINSSKPLQLLILTHTHYDHCGSAAELKKELGVKIIVGKAEVKFLKNGFTPLPEGTNLLTDWVSDLGKQTPGKGFEYPPVKANKALSHDWLYQEGIKVIMTPGHTKGSISVVVNDEVALVGDALSGMDESHIMPPYADDVNELLNSWGVLLETSCHSFLPGHGNMVRRADLEAEYTKFAAFKQE